MMIATKPSELVLVHRERSQTCTNVCILDCVFICGRSVCGTRSQLTDVYTQTQRRSEVIGIGINEAKLCSNVKLKREKKLSEKMYTKQLRGHMSWKKTSILSRNEQTHTHTRHHMLSKQSSEYARAMPSCSVEQQTFNFVVSTLALKHFVYALQRRVYVVRSTSVDFSICLKRRNKFVLKWKNRARAIFFSISLVRSRQQKKKKQQQNHRRKYGLWAHELVSWLISCYCFFLFLSSFSRCCRLLLHTVCFPLSVHELWM